jgi:hypothetical protein
MLLLGSVLLLGAWQRGSMPLAFTGGLLLAMKPQYVPAFLIILLAARAWRPLLAALLGCVVVGLSPLLAGGVHGMSAMVWSALSAGQGVIRYNESLIATLAPFLPGSWATFVGFGLWALLLIAMTWLAITRPQPALAGAALATSAGLIFAPHALPYDLVLIAVPVWLAYALYRRGEIPTPVPAALAIAAAMVLDLGSHFINLAPVVMLACLAIYTRLWLRRRPAMRRVSDAA